MGGDGRARCGARGDDRSAVRGSIRRGQTGPVRGSRDTTAQRQETRNPVVSVEGVYNLKILLGVSMSRIRARADPVAVPEPRAQTRGMRATVGLFAVIVALGLLLSLFGVLPGFGSGAPGTPEGLGVSSSPPTIHSLPANSSNGTAPPARAVSSLVYDEADHYLLMFGGCTASCNGSETFGDTWALENLSHGPTWVQLHPVHSPSPRWGEHMVYDAALGEVILFGGTYGGSTYYNDTWAFHAGNWTSVTTVGAPSVRQAFAFAYDPSSQAAVLFGGWDGSSYLGDTWTLTVHNGSARWSNASSVTQPLPRKAAVMEWDPTTQSILLFGGYGLTSPNGFLGFLGDTWQFANGSWSQLTPSSSPSARAASVLASDPSHRLVLFGGANNSGLLNDTYVYSNGTWMASPATTSPPARQGAMFAYDAYNGYAALFGGHGGAGCTYGSPCPMEFNDTWLWYGPSGQWVQASLASGSNGGGGSGGGGSGGNATSPPGRGTSTMTFDAADNESVLFGGCALTCDAAHTFGDTWAFAHGNWTELHPSTSPSARWNPRMAYDPSTGSIILFGGTPDGSSLLNDTWSFHNGTWSQVVTSTAPSPRMSVALAYDAHDGYLLLFGGDAGNGAYLNDTWEFNGTQWIQLHPSTAPAPRKTAGIAYDPSVHAVVLFGGYGSSGYLSDTWTYSGGVWTQVASGGNSTGYPSARAWPSMAWDGQEVLLFGGATSGSPAGSNDTWAYSNATVNATGPSWHALQPTASPSARYSAAMSSDPFPGGTLLFGGQDCSFGSQCTSALSDTWSWSGGQWTLLYGSISPPPPPPPAPYPAAVTVVVQASVLQGYAPLVTTFGALIQGGSPPFQVAWNLPGVSSSGNLSGLEVAANYSAPGWYPATAFVYNTTSGYGTVLVGYGSAWIDVVASGGGSGGNGSGNGSGNGTGGGSGNGSGGSPRPGTGNFGPLAQTSNVALLAMLGIGIGVGGFVGFVFAGRRPWPSPEHRPSGPPPGAVK